MGRPPTDHAAMRRRLVKHGRALIAARGVGRLAMVEVARREGLSTPALYHYFANRRALLLAVLRAEVEDMLVATAEASPAGASPHERLARFMEAQTGYLDRTNPKTLAFVLSAILDAQQDRQIRAVVAPVFGRAEAVFRECSAELGPEWTQERRGTVADMLRASLAGLFLIRALGVEVDAAAVDAELRSRMRVARRSSKSV